MRTAVTNAKIGNKKAVKMKKHTKVSAAMTDTPTPPANGILAEINKLIWSCLGEEMPKGVRNPRLEFGVIAAFSFVLYGEYIARNYPETIPKLKEILEGLK